MKLEAWRQVQDPRACGEGGQAGTVDKVAIEATFFEMVGSPLRALGHQFPSRRKRPAREHWQGREESGRVSFSHPDSGLKEVQLRKKSNSECACGGCRRMGRCGYCLGGDLGQG